jgi:SAM-dependent methyltransferase
MAFVERHIARGSMVDVGCWTGSLLVAARERGWTTTGLEPSRWASGRARERGLDVRTADLTNHDLPPESADLVAACDVLEHLRDPGAGLDAMRALVAPGGGVFLTVPDAGSRLARVTGRRWWSVLPMHLQYFTRNSMTELLRQRGFEVMAMATHPKVFTARYYAERVGGYSGVLERVVVGAVTRAGQAERLVAPDFRDRLAVVARRVR